MLLATLHSLQKLTTTTMITKESLQVITVNIRSTEYHTLGHLELIDNFQQDLLLNRFQLLGLLFS